MADSSADVRDSDEKEGGKPAASDDNGTQLVETKKFRKNTPKKRKRDHYSEAYKDFSFVPVKSTKSPGSPHRYFAESYEVFHPSSEAADNTTSTSSESLVSTPLLRIHKHVNGLCIVALSDRFVASDEVASNTTTTSCISHIELKQAPAPPTSAANKRKQRSKMLKTGKDMEGSIRPHQTLATIRKNDDSSVDVPCAIWGTLVEVNPRMSAELVQKDPLLSGYLAVVMPTGPFPPWKYTRDSQSLPGGNV